MTGLFYFFAFAAAVFGFACLMCRTHPTTTDAQAAKYARAAMAAFAVATACIVAAQWGK